MSEDVLDGDQSGPDELEVAVRVDPYQDCMRAAERMCSTGASAYVGTYMRHYQGRRHANYIGVFEVLGPLLVSFLEDDCIYSVLVRSVLGFRKLTFPKSCLYDFGDRDLCVLSRAVDQYFVEIYGGRWRIVEECFEEHSLISKINKLGAMAFGFGTRTQKTKSLEGRALDSEVVLVYSEEQRVKMLEGIRQGVLSMHARFSAVEVVAQLRTLDSAQNMHVAELDELDYERGFRVDVVVGGVSDCEFLRRWFGTEIKERTTHGIAREREGAFSAKQSPNMPSFESKPAKAGKEMVMVEFVLTEINYYSSLKKAHSSIFRPIEADVCRRGDKAGGNAGQPGVWRVHPDTWLH